MKILLTGGTGLIGRHLIPRLLELGHSVTVSTRHPDTARARLDPRVTLWRDFEGHHHLNDIDAVINLAGEPIADKRWTAEQKQRLCHSRWDLTQRLVGLIHASDTPPSVLISGSATGYYGDLGEVVVTEEEPPHNEFTHKLCARWEQIACEAQSERTRVCLLRTGVVLAPRGGILGKMRPPLSSASVGLSAAADSIWPGSISTIWLTAFCGCWITIYAVRSIWFLPTQCITNSSPTPWVMRSIDQPFSAFLPLLFAC